MYKKMREPASNRCSRYSVICRP